MPDLAGALNALRGELGLPPLGRENVASMVGDGVAKLVERGLSTAAAPGMVELEPMVVRFLALYDARLTAETVAYPGVLETLTDLRTDGWRCAVCTNKPEAASRRILAGLGLAPLFDTVAGGDSFAVRKPAAGHVLGTLAQMAAAPEAAVMVGDSRNDLLAARNAGLPAILVSYGYAREPAAALGADLVIERFAELPAALERLTRGHSASPRPAPRPPS